MIHEGDAPTGAGSGSTARTPTSQSLSRLAVEREFHALTRGSVVKVAILKISADLRFGATMLPDLVIPDLLPDREGQP